jgi:hypothetical protein
MLCLLQLGRLRPREEEFAGRMHAVDIEKLRWDPHEQEMYVVTPKFGAGPQKLGNVVTTEVVSAPEPPEGEEWGLEVQIHPGNGHGYLQANSASAWVVQLLENHVYTHVDTKEKWLGLRCAKAGVP